MIRQETRRTTPAGFTLLEILLVIAVIVIVGMLVLPTLSSMLRDTRVQAAADMCRSRASLARSMAIEQGRAYVLAASQDGRQIRVSPDDSDPAGEAAVGEGNLPFIQIDELPKNVVLQANVLGDSSTQENTADGWFILATFLPNGTCQEILSTFNVSEPDVNAVFIEIRGLTGTASIVPSVRQGLMNSARPGGQQP
jgi:prepilin-type N-terminal cleavage/methylation domain-containing protein